MLQLGILEETAQLGVSVTPREAQKGSLRGRTYIHQFPMWMPPFLACDSTAANEADVTTKCTLFTKSQFGQYTSVSFTCIGSKEIKSNMHNRWQHVHAVHQRRSLRVPVLFRFDMPNWLHFLHHYFIHASGHIAGRVALSATTCDYKKKKKKKIIKLDTWSSPSFYISMQTKFQEVQHLSSIHGLKV